MDGLPDIWHREWHHNVGPRIVTPDHAYQDWYFAALGDADRCSRHGLDRPVTHRADVNTETTQAGGATGAVISFTE